MVFWQNQYSCVEKTYFQNFTMAPNETVIRFTKVAFEFSAQKVILDEADFSVRSGMKMTIM